MAGWMGVPGTRGDARGLSEDVVSAVGHLLELGDRFGEILPIRSVVPSHAMERNAES